MMYAGQMGKDKKREAFSDRKPSCPSKEGCDATPRCVGNSRMPPELSQVPPPEGWPRPLERSIGDGGSRRYFCPVHGYFQAYPYGSLYKKRSRSEQLCSDDRDEGSSGESQQLASGEGEKVELAATLSQVTQQPCV